MNKVYEVSIKFQVEVKDDGRYPDANSVRKQLYDAVEMPGYMLTGLDVLALSATVVTK